MAPLTKRDTVTVQLTDNTTTTIVLIVGLALLTIVCLGLVVVFVMTRLRKQTPRLHEPLEKTPTSWPKFLTSSRPSTTEKQAAFDDIQREVLIQKSLAGRNGSMIISPVSPATENDIDIEEQQNLRTDWKKWEATVHHERSVSLEEHPALSRPSTEAGDLNIHPALRQTSPSWSPLSPLPRLPTLAAAPPATTHITSGPSHFLLGREASGGRYGPVAMDEDNKF